MSPPWRIEEIFAVVTIGLLGLVVGSFLNVVIARVPAGLSIVSPGSRCPKCERPIRWYENIPVFSWLALRGRCAGCKQPISLRYPLVELLTSLLFLACLVRFGLGWQLVSALVLVVFLVALTFIDLDTWTLPDELTYPGIAAGLILAAFIGHEAAGGFSFPEGAWVPPFLLRLRDAALGAGIAYLGFWAMEWLGEKLFKKEALGAGDKNLLALIGAFLTYRSLLAVVFLASLQGAIVGVLLLLATGRAGPATPPPEAPPAEGEDDWTPGPTNMPFGPWLSLAAIEAMLLGPWLSERLPFPAALLVGGG